MSGKTHVRMLSAAAFTVEVRPSVASTKACLPLLFMDGDIVGNSSLLLPLNAKCCRKTNSS